LRAKDQIDPARVNQHHETSTMKPGSFEHRFLDKLIAIPYRFSARTDQLGWSSMT